MRSKNRISDKDKALRVIGITIFILFAFPRLNIRLGPIPFYIIDFFLFKTFLYAKKLPKKTSFSFNGSVIFILFFRLSGA